MSADNFYVIRKHPSGGFAAVMGFASSEEMPEVRVGHHRSFDTVREAAEWAHDQPSEYGVEYEEGCAPESWSTAYFCGRCGQRHETGDEW